MTCRRWAITASDERLFVSAEFRKDSLPVATRIAAELASRGNSFVHHPLCHHRTMPKTSNLLASGTPNR